MANKKKVSKKVVKNLIDINVKMNENINSEKNNIKTHNLKNKIYSGITMNFSTFFGGPLAGTYMMSKNFKVFGKKEYSRNTLIIGILFTILLFLTLNFLSQNFLKRVPRYLIPLIYTGIFSSLVNAYQKNDLNKYVLKKENLYSIWNSLLIVILSIIITLIFGILLTYLK